MPKIRVGLSQHFKMIIDAHIHLYPEDVSANPVDWAGKRGETHWSHCVRPASGPQLQGWASADQLLRDMDEAGIDKAVILGWYWENSDTCLQNIDWQIAWVAQHPDRLTAFAPFNAKGERAALDSLKRAFDSGFRGIGEINPPAQGYDYDDPWLAKALELAASANAAVNVHVTEPVGRIYPGKTPTPFDQLQWMAEQHQRTTFIFAHLGGLLPFYEMNSNAKKALRNVYYDTAAVPLLYQKEVYRRICDTIGSERLIFGTDYPLRTFPKKQPRPEFRTHLEDLKTAGLNDEELENILGRNFERLISL